VGLKDRPRTPSGLQRERDRVLFGVVALVFRLRFSVEKRTLCGTRYADFFTGEQNSIMCLANWYGKSILPVIALRKWTGLSLTFGTGPVAVKRSEP
jgi:hypothetical protein